jgi:chromosome segregation ATPase
MKLLLPICLISITLFWIACGVGTDESLIQKIKSDMKTLENLPNANDHIKTLTDLASLCNNAPDNMREEANFSSISENVNSLLMKLSAMQSQKEDILVKFQDMTREYAAQKMSTEEVQKEYDAIAPGLQALISGLSNAETDYDAISTEYMKMNANVGLKMENDK